MNKQQLASKIWEAANKMRSKIEANEYKDYILGFIFYKFLSDKEVEFLEKSGWSKEDMKEYLSEEDNDTVEQCQKNNGYFIAYDNLFSTWLDMGKDFDVSNVTDALSAFTRLISSTHKKVFDRIFNTLETGLSKLGESSGARTKAISDLIQLIREIPMDSNQGYDVLGFIYEYLISNFAANAGKKAGEFYTPHEVSQLMSEIIAEHLQGRDKIEIYDPTSGSGSLLINIGNSVAKRMKDKNNIKYYAQELKENTYNLTRMNLIMRGILPDNICTRNGDTLEDDWPYFDEADPTLTYDPLYVDAVVSNPPYSQAWDPTNKESDPRYKRFGLAPKSKADYAFLLHDLYHIKPDGIMTIVLPHGVLFRGGEEENIRTQLIENNHIDTIIGLPANIFFGTGIPTIIMVLKQSRCNSDVLIVDASKGFEKVGKNNKLRASDIKRIVDTIIERKDVDKFSRVVSKQEIRDNGYNLNIPRYVDSSEKSESWDIYASMFGGVPQSEVDELNKYWNAFPSLKEQLYDGVDKPYLEIKTDEIHEVISKNSDVIDFAKNFTNNFYGFKDYLIEELIDNISNVAIQMEENKISNDIFRRLSNISLIDKYNAYQLLDDSWNKIAVDIEMIQTEGIECARKIEGEEKTVNGRIIPFELVQSTILKGLNDELKTKENQLNEISSEYSNILEEFSEEDKTEYSEILNDEGDAFISASVLKTAKNLKKDIKTFGEDSIELKIIHVAELIEREKALKKEVKILSTKLAKDTRNTIENLDIKQIKDLLILKWIEPLCQELSLLPETIVSELESKINTLTKKYSVTMMDLDNEIKETESSFANMIDELDGSEYDLLGLKELQKMLKGE